MNRLLLVFLISTKIAVAAAAAAAAAIAGVTATDGISVLHPKIDNRQSVATVLPATTTTTTPTTHQQLIAIIKKTIVVQPCTAP